MNFTTQKLIAHAKSDQYHGRVERPFANGFGNLR